MLTATLLAGKWALTARAEEATPPPGCTVNTTGTETHPDIQSAASDPSCHTVSIAAGYYTEIVTLTQDITITGAGRNLTTIMGDSRGSVFKCGSESAGGPTLTVKLANMKIQGGESIAVVTYLPS